MRATNGTQDKSEHNNTQPVHTRLAPDPKPKRLPETSAEYCHAIEEDLLTDPARYAKFITTRLIPYLDQLRSTHHRYRDFCLEQTQTGPLPSLAIVVLQRCSLFLELKDRSSAQRSCRKFRDGMRQCTISTDEQLAKVPLGKEEGIRFARCKALHVTSLFGRFPDSTAAALTRNAYIEMRQLYPLATQPHCLVDSTWSLVKSLPNVTNVQWIGSDPTRLPIVFPDATVVTGQVDCELLPPKVVKVVLYPFSMYRVRTDLPDTLETLIVNIAIDQYFIDELPSLLLALTQCKRLRALIIAQISTTREWFELLRIVPDPVKQSMYFDLRHVRALSVLSVPLIGTVDLTRVKRIEILELVVDMTCSGRLVTTKPVHTDELRLQIGHCKLGMTSLGAQLIADWWETWVDLHIISHLTRVNTVRVVLYPGDAHLFWEWSKLILTSFGSRFPGIVIEMDGIMVAEPAYMGRPVRFVPRYIVTDALRSPVPEWRTQYYQNSPRRTESIRLYNVKAQEMADRARGIEVALEANVANINGVD